jgi:hypothetical protein
MNNFDLVGALNSYCTTNDIVFLYGETFMQNYEASQHEYYNGQKILTASFTAQPLYGQGNAISQITYNGVMALGIKFDDDGTSNVEDDPDTPLVDETATYNDGTPASLDETHYQKYVRRLLTLMSDLDTVIRAIACANTLEITNCLIRLDYNKFDTNIDFAVAEITFVQ